MRANSEFDANVEGLSEEAAVAGAQIADTPQPEPQPEPRPLFEETMFSRNSPTICEDDQARLASAHAVVVGCGGLGGFCVEYLVRLGVGSLAVIDADTFAPSNLNRQVLATQATLGCGKAVCAAERARSINPDVRVVAHGVFLDESNAEALIADADVVVDALDNPGSRVVLETACEKAGVVLVHGAVRGKLAQVAVIHPGEGTLSRLYAGHTDLGEVSRDELRSLKSTLSFTPPLAAALEISEALKAILDQPRGIAAGEVLLLDAQTLRLARLTV